jgi:hypothetical protein
MSASPAGTSSSVNTPPIVKTGLAFKVAAGATVNLAGVAVDPDGDTVALAWTLMAEATGASTSGNGTTVKVAAGAAAGQYRLLVRASDGHGGASEATAAVTVAAGAASPGSVAAALPPPLSAVLPMPPSIYGSKLAVAQQLLGGAAVGRAFYQGAVLDVDAAATGVFNLSTEGWRAVMAASSCTWRLEGKGAATAGGATVYGCSELARFRLATPGSFTLALKVTNRSTGRTLGSASSQLTVAAKPFWGDFYTAASTEAFAAGRCSVAAQFAGTEFAPLSLACGSLGLPEGWGAEAGLDGAQQQLAFSWRLTPLSARAAAVHKQPLVRASTAGGPAVFGAVAAGIYRVELVGCVGGSGSSGSSGSSSTTAGGTSGGGSGSAGSCAGTVSARPAYALWGLLVVEPSSALTLTVPKPACAGSAVELAPARPALLAGQAAAPASWSVAWAEASTAAGTPSVLTGRGTSFSFVTQPGRYVAMVSIDVSEAGLRTRRLIGKASLDALPCITCTSAAITLNTSAAACAAAPDGALQLLAARPTWLTSGGAAVAFAQDARLAPGGPRAVGVVARSLVSNVTQTCIAPKVSVQGAALPAAALRNGAAGICVAPANGKWACWDIGALVSAAYACGTPLLVPACAAGTRASTCRVLASGRVCLQAALPVGTTASSVAMVDVAVKDASGNNRLREPLHLNVTVYKATRPGCYAASLAAPV